MKICLYPGEARRLKGGIKTSLQHQQQALDEEGIDYTTDPRDDYDILHVNLPTPRALYHIWKAKRQGKKVIIHTHITGEDFRDSMRFSNLAAPVVERYTSAIYRQADLLIAPSEYTRRLLRAKDLDVDIHVVSNGIDSERLDGYEDITGMKEKYGTDTPTVLNLGLIFKRKGLDDFIEVASHMPDVDFRWFGPELNRALSSGSTREKMESAPENLTFPGFVDDVREAFALGDIFFFPTHEENQGISLLEAAYCGLPIVVRDIPTYEGWLEHEVNCLKADSVAGFTDQLERLRKDPELRKELGKNAQEMAADHQIANISTGLKNAYRAALQDDHLFNGPSA
jgi:glycosyltransferase involved in cell wall biosynthesis